MFTIPKKIIIVASINRGLYHLFIRLKLYFIPVLLLHRSHNKIFFFSEKDFVNRDCAEQSK